MYKNIVVPIDLSEKYSWKSVVPRLLSLVTAFDAKLHLVHVIPDYGLQMVEDYLPNNWFSDQLQKSKDHIKALIEKYIPEEVEVQTHICKGIVYHQVIQYSSKVSADLIVVSAVSPKQKYYMLGPNASKIVRHAETSVLVIRDQASYNGK